MPLVQTRGAASAQGFGEFAQATVANYIEEVFSTYIYTGNGSTGQTINNGIDLSTKGGLVWTKNRGAAVNHSLVDTARVNATYNPRLSSNSSAAEVLVTIGYDVTSYTTTGYTLGPPWDSSVNGNTQTYVSWTFREQPKFFDVVTYTGNGTAGRTVAHDLGSVPGCMIVKRLNAADEWRVYHRSLGNTVHLNLNDTGAQNTGSSIWNSTTPTSTVFTVGSDSSVNGSGSTYVAYLFAHDAGGFGLSGTDNVISCGTFTTDGSGNATVSLGYEPQWVMIKNSGAAGYSWNMADSIRGLFTWNGGTSYSRQLNANTTGTEENSTLGPTSTGFTFNSGPTSNTFIYVAIRRGPMKVPTDATNVFAPTTSSATAGTVVTTNFPVDAQILGFRTLTQDKWIQDRLRGVTTTGTEVPNPVLATNAANAEISNTGGTRYWDNIGFQIPSYSAGYSTSYWNFRRAPSFFDEVCYTGTGVATTVAHNLAAVPELIIIKNRSSTNSGVVYTSSGGTGFYLRLFDSSSSDSGNTSTAGALWNNTTPTSSVFSIGTSNQVNGSTLTYVAYLFATCAGVSKVGSYTGTGATQTINCGFTGGARFVLIKKSTSTAPDRDWYVWDTARGMTSGTDPSLKINTTAAEVNANDVYTISTGFQLVSSSDYVNASGVTYIFLAIA